MTHAAAVDSAGGGGLGCARRLILPRSRRGTLWFPSGDVIELALPIIGQRSPDTGGLSTWCAHMDPLGSIWRWVWNNASPPSAPEPDPAENVQVSGMLRWFTAVFRGVSPKTVDQYTWQWPAMTAVLAALITGFICFFVWHLYKLAARLADNFSAVANTVFTMLTASLVVGLFAVLFAAMNPAVVDELYTHRPPT